MRIKNGFILRKVVDNYIAVAVGDEAVNFDAMISVNETGAFLWEKLQNETTEEDLLAALLDEYDVDEETAKADIAGFLEKLREGKLLV
ncbi:MAG: PqqD family protein [Clostridia bacterium]|nr:PqqD family protein [Clostridia bacterium]